ncbi:MAG TPA: hypothetical protein VNM72_02600 [Blastocatellia bacterium]|nr:hypothetical protein [Blastocatellia bacterium]
MAVLVHPSDQGSGLNIRVSAPNAHALLHLGQGYYRFFQALAQFLGEDHNLLVAEFQEQG